MRSVPRTLLRHRVKVRPYLGTNAAGEVFGIPVEVRCHFEHKVKMVRNAQGEEVSSSSHYIAEPDHRPPPNSEVTTPDGDKRRVVSWDRPEWPGMPVPANTHVYLD
jgi:hypothetical protein